VAVRAEVAASRPKRRSFTAHIGIGYFPDAHDSANSRLWRFLRLIEPLSIILVLGSVLATSITQDDGSSTAGASG
jgi:hypothetical protein